MGYAAKPYTAVVFAIFTLNFWSESEILSKAEM